MTETMKKTLISSDKINKAYGFEVKSVDQENHIVHGIFSTPAVDRHGEVVMQEGWKLQDYLANPVVLWSHDNYQFPLAQMVSLGFENGNLVGSMKFAVDEYDVAATAFRLMKGKYLRAFSVGFMNNVYEIDNGTDMVRLMENVLLEVSIVNVPANQEALAKIKSIDPLKDAEEKPVEDETPVVEDPVPDEKKPDEEPPVEDKKEDEEPELDAEGKAVELLSSSSKETIRSAISTLTGALGTDSEADTKVGEKGRTPRIAKAIPGGTKRIPVKLLNKAVRKLLKIKRNQKV